MWCVEGPPQTLSQSYKTRRSDFCFQQHSYDDKNAAYNYALRLNEMPNLKLSGYANNVDRRNFGYPRHAFGYASPDGRQCPDHTWKPSNICSGVDEYYCAYRSGDTGKCARPEPIATAKSFEESKKSKGGAMKNATADVLSMDSQVDAAPDQVLRVSHGTYFSCEHVKTAGACEHELAQQGCPVTCNDAKGVNGSAIKTVTATATKSSQSYGSDFPAVNCLNGPGPPSRYLTSSKCCCPNGGCPSSKW